ncbi:B12-binding domain-containing radical SAM protein [Pelobacter propionicus]|uniref:Radical SAM domain protein n=1 Tax=Pelobacter propionicus (strain DSM 2379 / NBRC 103807 / OttBd1) TaxID=338966 RepID=A1AM01_PELPD|nr:B12-binding domain-containing radical SAM protein [Pelobacter propionicus]ABK98371.1 Radical SAM domain protein [Pelobacter propionicus DSM 2379]
MRVILVAIHPYPSPQAVPLANGFLAAYQREYASSRNPVDVLLRDFFLHQDVAGCVAELLSLKPDVVGFSLYVWNRAQCLTLAEELRRLLPGTLLFAGGPEASADPRALLDGGGLDFLVAGEGEVTFVDVCLALAEGKGVGGIPGVVVAGGEGKLPSPRGVLSDLDAIPSPWLSGVLDASRYCGVLWQLSRGCAFSCDFCYDARGESGVRRFSLERVEAELRYFAAAEVSQVFVLDSTFNQDVGRAKAILRLIRKIAPRTHFHFEVRCEFLDGEMARLFAGITCSLQIGLQSADPRVLRQVGRSFRRDAFAAKVALLNRSGAVFGFDLMYGLPGDSLEGFRESVDYALSLYPNHLDIFPLAILPGTALAARADADGLCHLAEPPYTLLSSPTLSAADLGQARRLALACDVFYTRGKAVAWFNSVMAALGVRPSLFLGRFGEWLAREKGPGITEEALDDGDIWKLQRDWLTAAFDTKKLKRLLALVLDLVDYHHHYAAALLAPLEPSPFRGLGRTRLLTLPARLAPSTRLARFNYEILDILEAGEPDIGAFVAHAPCSGSWAAIYPRGDDVCTESLIEPYFRLLEKLDGRTPCGRIAANLGVPEEDALSFLEFAVAERIVIPQRG